MDSQPPEEDKAKPQRGITSHPRRWMTPERQMCWWMWEHSGIAGGNAEWSCRRSDALPHIHCGLSDGTKCQSERVHHE